MRDRPLRRLWALILALGSLCLPGALQAQEAQEVPLANRQLTSREEFIAIIDQPRDSEPT